MQPSPSRSSSVALAALVAACGGVGVPDGGAAPLRALAGRIITTNQGDATLSVIEPESGTVEAPILVPIVEVQNMEMPHEISADPAGRFFVIGLMEMPAGSTADLAANEIAMMNSTLPGWALKLSGRDGSLLAKGQVDPAPGDNELSADGAVSWVSCFNQAQVLALENQGDVNLRDLDGRIFALDTTDMSVTDAIAVCPEPHVLSLSPDGRRLFVTCLNDEVAVLDVVDPRSPTLVARVSEEVSSAGVSVEVLPSDATRGPYALQTSPAGPDGGYTVWVSNAIDDSVAVLDATSLTFVAQLPMLALPVFTTFSADGSKAYVAHQQPDGIAVFDTASTAQVAEVALGPPDCLGARQVLLSGDGGIAEVLCEGDHRHGGQYALVDLVAGTVLSSSTLGIAPMEMAELPSAP